MGRSYINRNYSMNREQRKYAEKAIDRLGLKKQSELTQQKNAAVAALADKKPAKCYMAALVGNKKEYAELGERMYKVFAARGVGDYEGCYSESVSIDLYDDTRGEDSDARGMETPLLRKFKKAYYDALDKVNADYTARVAKLEAHIEDLKSQIWLADLPGELADMLKAFEAQVF